MALTTNTSTNNGGITNHAIGSVVTDSGAAAVTTFTVGFAPRRINFVNLTDRIGYEWFEGMTSPGALKSAAAGTRTLETTEGITVGANSFTIPTSIILASKTFAWEAVG